MNTVDETMLLLAGSASEAYYGEPVTQLEHALQTAELARTAGADDETILAALLHDIGHVLERGHLHQDLGVIDHDQQGAAWLRERGFSERLVQLVGAHVAAKRYLVAANASYAGRLSGSSVRTLELQGGPTTPEEVAAFEQDPLMREKLRMRSWDEQAKVPDVAVAPLESYRELIERHLAQQ
jgi:phosphonate degradation associated HDIG domain protein